MSEVKAVLSLDQLCAKYGQEIAEKVSKILFHIDKSVEAITTKLKEGRLHNELVNEFKNMEIRLDENLLYIEQENERKWQIKSDKNQFVIEKWEQKLSIYKKEQTPSDAKKAEVLITKALSVLQDQGLYAFVLFCESRSSRERTGAEEIKNLSKKLLRELDLINDGDFLEELRRENGLLTKLDDLMLAIQVLEKSLIYARFHAKAIKESQGESP